MLRSAHSRVPSPVIWPRERLYPLAQRVVSRLMALGLKAQLCGSLRRGCKDSKDIDIVVLLDSAAADSLTHVVVKALAPVGYGLKDTRIGSLGHFRRPGTEQLFLLSESCDPPVPQLLQLRFNPADSVNPLLIDLWLVSNDLYGFAVFSATGSWPFLVGVHMLARTMDLRLSDSGLCRESGELFPTPEEEDVFNALGLRWIDPTTRDERTWPLERLRGFSLVPTDIASAPAKS